EPGPEPALAEPPAGQPPAEGLDARRPVRAEVRVDRSRGGFLRVGHARPARAGRLRSGEGDPTAPARPEADVALPGEGLQQGAPSRAERVADMPQSPAGGHRADQLVAGEDRALEGLARGEPEELDLVRAHPEVPLPARPLPGAPRGHQ